jgi:hypothetical protein
MSVVNLARTMYAGGWTIAQIRDYLRGQGHASLSENTVRWWVRPEEAEHYRKANLARYHAKRAPRKAAPKPVEPPNLDGPVARLRRLRQLHDAGLPFTAVAIVYRMDTGVDLSAERIRYLLTRRAGKRLTPLWERKLMGAA